MIINFEKTLSHPRLFTTPITYSVHHCAHRNVDEETAAMAARKLLFDGSSKAFDIFSVIHFFASYAFINLTTSSPWRSVNVRRNVIDSQFD